MKYRDSILAHLPRKWYAVSFSTPCALTSLYIAFNKLMPGWWGGSDFLKLLCRLFRNCVHCSLVILKCHQHASCSVVILQPGHTALNMFAFWKVLFTWRLLYRYIWCKIFSVTDRTIKTPSQKQVLYVMLMFFRLSDTWNAEQLPPWVSHMFPSRETPPPMKFILALAGRLTRDVYKCGTLVELHVHVYCCM